MQNWTLITGASKGVGAALARLLASQGYALLLHFRHSQKDALSLAKECRELGATVELIQGDFSSSKGTQSFVQVCLDRYPTICNLVCSVGPYEVGSVCATSEKKWRELFETNFFSPRALIAALIPLIQSKGGGVVTLGVAGVNDSRAENYSTAYFTAKKALWTYVKALAMEVAPHLVSVNMVSPGRLLGAVDAPENPMLLPMGREGTQDEVARVIAFLLQKENRYITGQNIEVAGGVRL